MEIVPFNHERSEEFIRQQVEIGLEESENWEYYYQSPVEVLREKYSGDGFDPSTRLYAVEGNEVLGFITAKIIVERSEDELFLDEAEGAAVMMVPMVRARILERRWMERELIRSLLSVLATRGVTRVVCNIGENWGKKEVMETEGFLPQRPFLLRAELQVNQLCELQGDDHGTVEDCNEFHYADVAKLLRDTLGYSVETAMSILRSSPYEETHSFCHIEEELKAWASLSRSGKRWQMGPVHTRDGRGVHQLLKRIGRVLQGEGVEDITVLCGIQGQHLLKYLPFDFEPVMVMYVLEMRG